MEKTISIVMGYYNRKKLLERTLKSIEKSKYKNLTEIIIVDDGSDNEERLEALETNLSIKIIRIDKKNKTWINPSIPYNIGLKAATTDKIIIQNPECLHVGDIIEHVLKYLKDGVYLNFGCYSIDNNILNRLNSVSFENESWVKEVEDAIQIKNKPVVNDGDNGWYNHIIYRPTFLHFCSAITKNDLEKVGYFDERFANGIAFEDSEFLHRVKNQEINNKKMKIMYIEDVYVVHQYHGKGYVDNNLIMKNAKLYQELTQKK